MALFSNLVPFIFFLFTLLLLSLQIHGRDSQFFSKVTNPINNNNNGKETDLPNKKDEPVKNKPDQQEPVFIPETDDNYGLYGHHESTTGQFPPATTTTTYQPYKTGESDEENMSKYPNKYSYYNRNENDFIDNNNYYKDAYGNDLDKTRYAEGRYENVSNQMRKQNQKLYNSNDGGYDRY